MTIAEKVAKRYINLPLPLREVKGEGTDLGACAESHRHHHGFLPFYQIVGKYLLTFLTKGLIFFGFFLQIISTLWFFLIELHHLFGHDMIVGSLLELLPFFFQ
jgi:hypothetical protein